MSVTFDDGLARAIVGALGSVIQALNDPSRSPAGTIPLLKQLMGCFPPHVQPKNVGYGSGGFGGVGLYGARGASSIDAPPVREAVGLWHPDPDLDRLPDLYPDVKSWKSFGGYSLPAPGKWELWEFSLAPIKRIEREDKA